MDITAILGILICFSIVGTYCPQFYKIISNKTSDGINHWFIFIGLIGCVASVSNAIVFYSNAGVECDGFIDCSLKLLGMYQIILEFLVFVTFYLLALIYLPKFDTNVDHGVMYMINTKLKFVTRKEFKILMAFIIIMIITFILTIIFTYQIECNNDDNQLCIIWAKILGWVSLGTVFVQFLPQIYEVYRNKKVGSLSMITLGLQIIQNGCWTVYLFIDPESDLTTWLPYLGTTTFQFVLISCCLYISIKYKQQTIDEYDMEETIPMDNYNITDSDSYEADQLMEYDIFIAKPDDRLLEDAI